MNRFENKRILITGGTSGMGLEAAKQIVEEGGEVAVTGTTQEHLDEAGKALPSGSLVLRNDASDPEAAKELGAKVKEQMGTIDQDEIGTTRIPRHGSLLGRDIRWHCQADFTAITIE